MKVRDNFQTGRAALLRGLDFWRRGSAALPLIAAILFFAVGAAAETTNILSDAQIQGRKLAQQLLDQRPVTNFFQKGVLTIRDGNGTTTNIPISIGTSVSTYDWEVDYSIKQRDFLTSSNLFMGSFLALNVMHMNEQTNVYVLSEEKGKPMKDIPGSFYDHVIHGRSLDKIQIFAPFANSDFWICDLGLEFFHWPEQKILKHEMRRGRACKVLESVNPSPSTSGYSRVVSWIDNESGGIVQAEAYDFKNKLLKEFAPKSFKKVNGQWELQEMEIRNVQTGSRTRLEFDDFPSTNPPKK